MTQERAGTRTTDFPGNIGAMLRSLDAKTAATPEPEFARAMFSGRSECMAPQLSSP
jgi:hypothetical protein